MKQFLILLSWGTIMTVGLASGEPLQTLFNRGKSLFEQKRYAEAYRSFILARGQTDDPCIALWLGRAAMEAGQDGDALIHLRDFQTRCSKADQKRDEVNARLLTLRTRAGVTEKVPIPVEVKPTVTQPAPTQPAPIAPEPPISAPSRDLVRIEAGTFTMGSPLGELGRDGGETQHVVQITRPFLLSRTEITQEQYETVMGVNPSQNTASMQHPVEKVSWLDAVRYCNARSEAEHLPSCYDIRGESVRWPDGLNCRGFRLPTEAEWEYAARAGQRMRNAGSNDLALVGWADTSQVHPVAAKSPNPWGLYDMSGNVREWVWDWQGSYPSQRVKDPIGPESGFYRVTRGGSWLLESSAARVASRLYEYPDLKRPDIGFRVVRSLP